MNKTLIKATIAVILAIGLTVVLFQLVPTQVSTDPRLLAAQEAAQHLQERLEVIAQINDHKEAIEQLKVREQELQKLENEAKKRSIDTENGYNYLESAF